MCIHHFDVFKESSSHFSKLYHQPKRDHDAKVVISQIRF